MAAHWLRKYGKLPQTMIDKPILKIGLQLFFTAFNQLSSCRSSGMSIGPIPWTAIAMWCNEYKLVDGQRRAVFLHVRVMDLAYMEYVAKSKPT